MRQKRSPFAIPVMIGVAALLALLIYGVVQKQGGDEFDKAVAAGKREPAPVRTVRKLGSRTRRRRCRVPRPSGAAELLGQLVRSRARTSRRRWSAPTSATRTSGFVVLGAGVDDLTKDAQAFVKRYGLTYPIVKYGSANATKDFGTRYMPESFVIDREGRIVALRRGQVDDEWLNDNIAPVVAEQMIAAPAPLRLDLHGRSAAAALLALAPAAAAAADCRVTSLPEIEDEVMCPICGVPLVNAGGQQAENERNYIRDLVDDCKTKEQIKAALVDEYGDEVLAVPSADGFGLAAYLVPIGGIALAAVAVAIGAVRWRPRSRTQQTAARSALRQRRGDGRIARPSTRGRLDSDMQRYDL